MMLATDKYKNCKNEQQFKMLFIRNELQRKDNAVFCIETEETVLGFPDVMLVRQEVYHDMKRDITLPGNFTEFYEFKISDAYGNIKFKPTQPSFYKRHDKLNVQVVALNRKSGKVHIFSTGDLAMQKSKYFLNAHNSVSLDKAEAIL
jgi:hypothetical protein